MTILVTGATGAVGARLVERLVAEGEKPRIASRSPSDLRERWPDLEATELDVLRPATIGPALDGVRAAYYLVHSMESASQGRFEERDAEAAALFGEAANDAGLERVIYLGGLGDESDDLSEHLESRHETGRILAETGPPLLEFRASMVIGADSASFRMLSDLVERLPAMVVPRWVDTPTQPIAIDDVMRYLVAGLDTPLEDAHTIVEIGGPDVTTYRSMIETVAAERGRAPTIVGVPLLSLRLSSHWLGLVTSVSTALAKPLVQSMATPTVVRGDEARRRFPDIEPVPLVDALREALTQT
ncbi:MAG TPA: NAD(P)H-binding protein [Actinomycetota bacterium]